MVIFEKCMKEGKKNRERGLAPLHLLCCRMMAFQPGGSPGGQVVAPRRSLDRIKKGSQPFFSIFPQTLLLFFLSHLFLPSHETYQSFINSYSNLPPNSSFSCHPHHLAQFSLLELSLSSFLVRENDGERKSTTLLVLHCLPPLSKIILELNPLCNIMNQLVFL